ncbi:alpha/beta hydrolase [Streptomyces sp. NPDC001890]|uniref:alpha/beta hydrolase n=1 Tax=Streptomyces sp. NPDC001890 TaxID=3364620 RepID=UPI0036C59D6A
MNVLTTVRAEDGARGLLGFVSSPKRVDSNAWALLCHSYGSVVVGRAASGLDVAGVAVYGSPGSTTDSSPQWAQWGNTAQVRTPAENGTIRRQQLRQGVGP